ncbi:MAG: phenylalanine--tRNA ligase subunit beta [Paludibacteraceae bacterium]|nr:phenylalanine--tRNA ligase subunit beta [Paludibacteraceae bacterium]
MKISYNWLKKYIALQDDPHTVGKILTSIGLEVGTVEKVQSIQGGLEGLVVGEVITCVPHPNSDHLHITTTRLQPNEEPVQIVCGAPNVQAGQKVIVATVGTRLYSGEESFVIKKSKIRGEESCGMICAEDEIGVGNSHDGIIVLPPDTPVGMLAKDFYEVEDDYVIEVDITPNRADALSHFGVARDLFAYYSFHNAGNVPALTPPSVDDFKVQSNAYPVEVQVVAKEACPRYTGVTVKGIEIKDSPAWLQNCLRTIGVRPINNVVDVSNFVLHELGTPLHTFDADHIKGKKIVVDLAKEGEKFVTLDGLERTLSANDLMIKNAEESMCIAGVFGGLESGISETTKNVFIESAYFNPIYIRKTARRHQLSTDASFRFERGCNPCNSLYVLKRCATLIQEVAGGEIAMEIADVADDLTALTAPFSVKMSYNHVKSLIGKEITQSELETILGALEIKIKDKKSTADDVMYDLQVPKYRVDVQRECDVIEDVLRIYGYNNVPFTDKMSSSLSYAQSDAFATQRTISDQLSSQGFNEILNNSLSKMQYYQEHLDECVQIKNPLSQDLAVMRQTLLYGGLESISRNVNRQISNLQFYEFGNCYHRVASSDSDPLNAYREEKHLGLWLTGNKTAQSWVLQDQKVSFYQLHAYVNNILIKLGCDVEACQLEPLKKDEFADGLMIMYQNKPIGYMGIVSAKVLKEFDMDNAVYFADLYWKELLQIKKNYQPVIVDIPKFPEVKRDFALLVDKSLLFADIKKIALETERKLLKNVYLFDVFEGKGIEEGKKSYALSFILQDTEKTLKDSQIENVMARLQKAFEEKLGAKLR